MSNWVGTITQAVITTMCPNSSSHSRRLEAAKMVETARRLGAQEFRGTTDPLQVEDWIKRIERVFEMMECPKERKVNIAAFLLEGRALNWWTSIINRKPQGKEMT